MMFICIKQHLSNNWSSIYEQVRQHWDWVDKSVVSKKSVYTATGYQVTSYVLPVAIQISTEVELSKYYGQDCLKILHFLICLFGLNNDSICWT